MLFTKGESLTVSFLQKIFQKMFRKVNEASSYNVKSLTTGQLLDVITEGNTDVVIRPMSISTEQYFDTTYIVPYNVGYDSDIKSGGWSFMKFYLDEIQKLEDIHGK